MGHPGRPELHRVPEGRIMKRSVIAAGAGVLALVAIAQAAPTSTALRKDRAALMIYDGKDRVISLVTQADSANLALILLHGWEGSDVPIEKLEGRPCIGVALFSKSEWWKLLATGRKPEEFKPSETSMRKRLYPARGNDSAAVFDIATGKATVAAAFYQWDKAIAERSIPQWSVRSYVDRATGPCTVE